MANKFPSLSSFLNSTKKLERDTMENALNSSAEQEIQKILNESAVRLTVYNNIDVESEDKRVKEDTAEFIRQGIKEATEMNARRVKSILDDLFSSLHIEVEREQFWINKLCSLFSIDLSLPDEDKYILIERQLALDEDTLNYVTYIMELGEKKKKD